MLGYSLAKNEVFVFQKGQISEIATPKKEVTTKILPLLALSKSQRIEVKQLQGRVVFAYLAFRYGSSNTYILLAYVEEVLAHVEWIVPATKIRGRYPFVTEKSYSIISCLTSQSLRGLGIYPSQIQKVVKSDVPAKMFWIWTESAHTASLKGIRKAGGVKAGEFLQTKWFWGCASRIEYSPERGGCR